MTTTITKQKIVWFPNSLIGEFDCGEWNGHASVNDAVKEHYTSDNTFVPARPKHYEITFVGINRAWRSYRMPYHGKRGLEKAIYALIEELGSPESIDVYRDGLGMRYGKTIDRLNVAQ